MRQRLNTWIAEGLLFAFVLLWSCGAESADGGAATQRPACNNVVLYSFPEETTLDSTARDNRPYLVRVTQARINLIALAAATHCLQFGGEYPLTYTEMLRRASEIPPERAACRLSEDLLDDGWDHPIYYQAMDHRLSVVSAGPDGRFATADDIVLPQGGTPHTELVDIGQQCAKGPSLERTMH